MTPPREWTDEPDQQEPPGPDPQVTGEREKPPASPEPVHGPEAEPSFDKLLVAGLPYAKIVDKFLDMLKTPEGRAGIGFVLDKLRGREIDPAMYQAPAQASRSSNGAAQQSSPREVKTMEAKFNIDKFMDELKKALALIVQFYGDEPINTLPGLLDQNWDRVKEQLEKTLRECVVQEVPNAN